jgi:alcohol dehydrogenase
MTHGVAIGIMLPHVIRYNGQVVGSLYGELAHDAGIADQDDPSAADLLADMIESWTRKAGQPTDLAACDVSFENLPQMAEEAAAQWTGNFNPRPVDSNSLEELYQCAFPRKLVPRSA